MDKRRFLKTTGAFLTSTLLPRFATAEITAPRTNWAGNLTYHTDNLLIPKTVEETQSLVKSTPKLRALGTRHSFNTIADSTHAQISLQNLDSMVVNAPTTDKAKPTVTVGPGVRYGTLAPWLDQQSFALHNLASLPHITVVGAVSTGTHGSGIHNGNLSTAVAAIGRSKGGLSTKIHAAVDALGNPLGFHLTAGQACDLEGADVLLPLVEADTG
jgi:xylitol oxidase